MKLKKLLCLLMTAAMLASLIVIPASAASTPVSISFDISGNAAKCTANKVTLSREYREYKGGDADPSAFSAYKIHNMVFDGGKKDGQMTYLSPNPYSYWHNGDTTPFAVDFGGMGPQKFGGRGDLSYIAYKIQSTDGSAINGLFVRIFGALAPSVNESGDKGWSQFIVSVFPNEPWDANGVIDYENFIDAEYAINHVRGNMTGSFVNCYQDGNALQFDLSDEISGYGNAKELYVVVASYISGGMSCPDSTRLSGYGSRSTTDAICRLSGVEIKTVSATQAIGSDGKPIQGQHDVPAVSNDIYVDPVNGNDSNDGSQTSPVKTIKKANELAAAKIPDRAIVHVPDSMLTLGYAKENGTAKAGINNSTVQQYLPGVVFWGDSLTAGTATTGYDGKSAYNPYPIVVGNLITSNLISDFSREYRPNYGVGGENAATIVGRANAIPVVLSAAANIPASGSVEVKMQLQGSSDSFTPLKQANSGGKFNSTSTPVTINGIAGTLKLEGGKYTFTRSAAGSATTAASGTQVVFTVGNEFNNSNYIPVVFIGYNDGATNAAANNSSKLISYIDAILNKYPQYKNNKRYIVICPHFKATDVENAKKVEANLEAKYGEHLIKTREFMSSMGPYEMGIKPTTTDFSAMAKGQIPNCLMSTDGTHYSYDGYELVGKLVYQKMHDLGYFAEVVKALGVTEKGPCSQHVPGAEATCTKPQVCTLCGAVITPATGRHVYQGGTCIYCGQAESTPEPVIGEVILSPSKTANLKVEKYYDVGKIYADQQGTSVFPFSVEPCLSRPTSKVVINSQNALQFGATIAHNVFVDTYRKSNTSMSYIHCGEYDWYDPTYMESDNAYSVDFLDPSTITSGYDFSYLGYRISAGESKHLTNIKVNVYGATWPTLAAGPSKNRSQIAVFVTNKINIDNSGRIDFGTLASEGYLLGAKGDVHGVHSFYHDKDKESFSIDCSSVFSKFDGTVGDVYVFVVLFCGGFGIGEDGDRVSGYNTSESLRLTAVKIEGITANGAATVLGNENGGGGDEPAGCQHSMTLVPAQTSTCKVQGNSAYYVCSKCQKLFTDISGNNETTATAVKLPLAGHDYSYIPSEAGHVGVCKVCQAQGTLEAHTFNQSNKCTVCGYESIPAGCQHSMTLVPAQTSTCKVQGNSAYYVCSKCQKLFTDIGGNNETTAAAVKLPLASHDYSYIPSEAGHVGVCKVCQAQGTLEAHTFNQSNECTVCGYKKGPGPDVEIPGDLNGDGVVTAADAIYLLNYSMFGAEEYPVSQDIDYDGSGAFGDDDIDYLLMSIILPSVYPLYPGK